MIIVIKWFFLQETNMPLAQPLSMPMLNTTCPSPFHRFTLLWIPCTRGRVWIITTKYTKMGLESFNGNPWWSSSNAFKDGMKRRGKERAEGEAEKSCPGVNTAPQPWSEMNGRPSVRDRQTNNCFPSVLTSPHQAPGPPSLYFISPNPKRGAEMNSFLQNFAEEEKKKKKENTVASPFKHCSRGEESSKERRGSSSLSSCAKD